MAPGNSIGTLNVTGDVTFAPGSTYVVELSPTSSDRIVAGGSARIGGATVSLSLENSPTLLSTTETRSLLGHSYDILQAAGGIQGQFGAVLPDYLFIGGNLDYAANAIQLDIQRNATSFASVGQTPNQRAVATAVEGLAPATRCTKACCCQRLPLRRNRRSSNSAGKSTRHWARC